jgi:cytochrome c oxidase subunit 2
MRRRSAAGALVAFGASGLLAAVAADPAAQGTRSSPRRIAVTARKFAFSETEIQARQGESISLEITSVDFVHGFALPQLGARVDAPPGRTATLVLADLREGRYTYLCDNFCGEAHDRMAGTLVVA